VGEGRLTGGRGLGLEQVPVDVLEALNLRLLAAQLASENIERFIKGLHHVKAVETWIAWARSTF